MKNLNKAIAFLFLAVFAANAQNDNTRVSVYLHPISFFTYYAEDEIVVYSTVEIPLNLSFALIIYPDVWIDSKQLDKYASVSRVGSGLGIRYFLNERGDGMYLQALADLHYYSIKDELELHGGKGVSNTFMLYLGNAYKFRRVSIFSDIGVGIGNAKAKHKDILYSNKVYFDFSLGIGIPF
jgi:hypothetical protein